VVAVRKASGCSVLAAATLEDVSPDLRELEFGTLFYSARPKELVRFALDYDGA
jgi:hypothetical protein